MLFNVEITGVPKEETILHGDKASLQTGNVVPWHRHNTQYEKQQKVLKIQSEHESREQMPMAFKMPDTAIIPHDIAKMPQAIDVLATKIGFTEDSLEVSALPGMSLQLVSLKQSTHDASLIFLNSNILSVDSGLAFFG